MTVDDLNAPLGQKPKTRRRRIKMPVPQIMAGALALFLGVFVLWAIVADDPFGGEPMAVTPVNLHLAAKPTESPAASQAATAPDASVQRHEPSAPLTPPPAKDVPANTTTITIIDGKTGARQEVQVPGPANPVPAASTPAAPIPPSGQTPAAAVPLDQRFSETSPHGPIPKIAADGTRPADAFARPVQPLSGRPDAPRIALIVSGLGISASATTDAIAKLPGAVTFGFVPYATNAAAMVARIRNGGHEVLLQVPMEPFGYPDNDPGPQTLLTSLTPPQNIDRLYWLMSRFQGYVGVSNTMGARFTASEPSFAPILREIAKRGLIFVDDGSNPRSIAGRIAGANNLPYVQADVILDSVPTPADIDRALGRLEMTARERGTAVGIASALPVSIDHIAKWAKAAESRGLLLVPVSAAAAKAKQS
jgi:polysaccharide deacetylase 2 family uncharacterized protein YibQ